MTLFLNHQIQISDLKLHNPNDDMLKNACQTLKEMPDLAEIRVQLIKVTNYFKKDNRLDL